MSYAAARVKLALLRMGWRMCPVCKVPVEPKTPHSHEVPRAS